MRRFIQQCNLKCVAKSQKKIQIASLHQLVKTNRISFNTYPTVSTTFRHKNSSASPSLSDILANEIEEEKENGFVDEELEKIKKTLSKQFKITDQKGLGVVKLTRKYNDELIEVVFDCQNSRDGDNDLNEIDGEENENSQDDEEEGGSSSVGIEFEVTISKGNSKVIFDCVASEVLEIDNVRYIGSDHSSKDLIEVYGGPIFTDLDEGLVYKI